jgi:ATP-binding cassette subfamily C protein
MLKNLRQLIGILTKRERRQLVWVFLAMIALAVVEVAGVSSIAPFLTVAANPGTIETNRYLRWAFETFGFQSTQQFLVALGLGVVAFVILRNGFLALTNYILIRYSHMRNYSLSKRLLAEYLSRPYVFFLGKNTSELNRDVLAEVNNLIKGYLVPALHLFSRALIGISIVAFLVAINPVVAAIVALALGLLYGGVYALVRNRLASLGRRRFEANRGRFQIASEAFSGIKDIKLLGKERSMVKEYEKPARTYARVDAMRNLISNLPKYALESVALGGVMLVVVFVIAVRESYMEAIPVIGVYVFAAYRLMPALQNVFTRITSMRSNEPVVQWVTSQFDRAPDDEPKFKSPPKGPPLPLEDRIDLESIYFNYPNTDTPAIKGLSVSIQAGTTVGLVGPTGCGKTTTVDIILGLLAPQQGKLLVDGVPVQGENLRRWQINLGYVPQQIYLSDSSLARNIAFGVPEDKVDMEAVERASRVANLHHFVEQELPEGYRTFVGERGVRLSGGQRQRVGIARAVYHNPSVLVLDEATSALDSVTESAVMDAIHNLAHEKTIIVIAHRITTVRECDNIYLLDNGRVVEQGGYEELLEKSERFRALAKVRE